jgi:hypothetical protein
MSALSAEWERMQALNAERREAAVRSMQEEEERRAVTTRVSKAVLDARWSERTSGSPLHQNLLVEQDRVAAHAKVLEYEAVKTRTETTYASTTARAHLAAALIGSSQDEVKALREQRRQLEVQEKRLRALLEAEKIKLVTKDEHSAARVALRERRGAHVRARRETLQELQKARLAQEQAVHKMGVGLLPPPPELIAGLRALYAPPRPGGEGWEGEGAAAGAGDFAEGDGEEGAGEGDDAFLSGGSAGRPPQGGGGISGVGIHPLYASGGSTLDFDGAGTQSGSPPPLGSSPRRR